MGSAPAIIYIEFLTVSCFIRDIFPVLRKSSGIRHLYIFDTTISAFFLSRLLGRIFGFNVDKLSFQMADARDDHGACVYLRVRYQHLAKLQALIFQEAPIQEALKDSDRDTRLEAYLAKASVYCYSFNAHAKHSELWHALVLIGITQWHKKKSAAGPALIHLYMYNRPFWRALMRYAEGYGVIVHNTGTLRLCHPIFKKIWSFCTKIRLPLILSLLRYPGRIFFKKESPRDVPENVLGPARMMAEHFGQFNVDRPGCISDLFFLDPQGIHGTDVYLVFNNSKNPVDDIKWHQMSARGVKAIALTLQSSLVDEARVPIFRHEFRACSADEFPAPWRDYVVEYRRARDYWSHFFRAYNIRLWATWAKYDATHMAIADAINDVGGISSVYQRSFESNPSPYYTVGSDLIFGFSSQGCDVHLKSGSNFKYYITVGFIGDSRFEYLRPLAQNIRRQLFGCGAERIVAYFDDNTFKDGRWITGHKLLRENYAFWLNKLFEDKKLGVIFKTKIPVTLRERLGPVADLLSAAEKTGRCYVFNEGGTNYSAFPPAVAAMAADIAIQDTFWAGTAAIEAALSGAKSLLVDFEGHPQSSLYRLGPNVVFRDWTSVWSACLDHWKTPGGNPVLGNWSSVLEEMDPFRDGLAKRRLSGYLKELLEGLRAGIPAKDVMEKVAQRYAEKWGKDKVQRIKERRKIDGLHDG